MDSIKYLDKVVDFLVKDTVIDYEEGEIKFPSKYRYSYFSTLPLSLSTNHQSPKLLNDYCKDMFGLTDLEINYVWERYRKIIIHYVKKWKIN